MRGLLPKSLNGYLLLGISVIAVPLLFAIGHAWIQMRQLTDFSQTMVKESVQTTRLAQNMFMQIGALERNARHYQVLGTPQPLADVDESNANLAATLRELHVKSTSARTHAALAPLGELQAQVVGRIHAMPSGTAAPATAARAAISLDFTSLTDQATTVATLIGTKIDSETASLQAQTAAAQRELLWESSLLFPLALAATLSFLLGISRPIRQVDRAITELGSGNFGREIAVSGPVDLQRLGQQLEWLRTRLLELAQERNRFLRHMSHELKTPLANIREGTELLMDGAVGELKTSQREVTSILQENSIKLQRMIENLLSFSAWQSNNTGLDLSEFRIRPLIKQVLENQQLTLVSQRVRLDVQVEDVTLLADRNKIRLIMENLLSNAIKYSPRGGTICVRARSEGSDLQLEVADTGAGIPPEERASVFEAFHTGRAPNGHVPGTGIGLSVVHEFVQVHRGSIEIVDGEFPGAHFRIRMPQRAAVSAASNANLARRRIHAA